MSSLKKHGFTLIEVLIVIAIIGVIIITVVYSVMQNLANSRDTRRKADIARIKVALEDYYGDKSQYPTTDLLDACESQELSPYLKSLPCDPKTKQPYCYIYDAEAPVGQNYRLLAALENNYDEVITKLGCANDTTYCGYETTCATYGSGYNYGVSSSDIAVLNPIAEVSGGGTGDTSSPTPTPSINPTYHYACGNNNLTGQGVCGYYSDPVVSQCGITFATESECQAYCPTSPVGVRCVN